jgi:DNA polymerase V
VPECHGLEGFGAVMGMALLDLGAPGQAPVSLFDIIDAPDDGLMKAMDQINARYGRGTARLSLAQKDGEWHMRRENLSPSFTTRWGDIPSAKMGSDDYTLASLTASPAKIR